MLAIKLQRIGKKKEPHYRVVAIDKQKNPQGRAVAILGHYNPRDMENKMVVNADMVVNLIKKGAQPTETVHNLLVINGVISGEKKKTIRMSRKRRAKLEEAKSKKTERTEAAEETLEEPKSEQSNEDVPSETPTEENSEDTKTK